MADPSDREEPGAGMEAAFIGEEDVEVIDDLEGASRACWERA